MNPEVRLAEIVAALQAVGLNCLVMGGHAVRYYGLQRNTNDYDLHLAPDRWSELPHLLQQSPFFHRGPVVEGASGGRMRSKTVHPSSSSNVLGSTLSSTRNSVMCDSEVFSPSRFLTIVVAILIPPNSL